MTAVVAAACVGSWRRTLLVEADGSRNTDTGVMWLQGVTAYVDSRGFAGTLHQRGDVFEWHRDIDLQPAGPYPDAGRMRWDAETLIETGVHADYVEHWVRDPGEPDPCGAAFLTGPDGHGGLLLRVGAHFGFACRNEVAIGEVGGAGWNAIGVDEGSVYVGGVRWNVRRSEGILNL